jgi:hypothetical protein
MLLYAYGAEAPSAKDIPERWIYEMALEFHKLPDEIRSMNIVDRNKLRLVRRAQMLAMKQRALTEQTRDASS